MFVTPGVVEFLRNSHDFGVMMCLLHQVRYSSYAIAAWRARTMISSRVLFVTSGVVEFLRNSRVACAHDDFKSIKYDEYLKKLDLNETESVYTHDFRLASAYNSKIITTSTFMDLYQHQGLP